jgi:D-alanine-D-alanine ligase
MARVDFLYGTTIKRNKPALFLSEINTIPGFTEISMYPKLLEHGGLKLEKVIVTLINLAIKKYNLKKKLVTNFD